MSEVKLPNIFYDACGIGGVEWMCKPFGKDGKVYSTDGRIMVRCNGDAPLAEKAPADIANLFLPEGSYSDPVEIPATDHGTVPCYECRGTGLAGTVCPGCDGEGVIDCPECGHEAECKRCDGQGKIFVGNDPCPECNGTKRTVDSLAAVDLGSVKIRFKYADMLRRAGVTHVRPNKDSPSNRAMYFSGDGFDGILMPVIG